MAGTLEGKVAIVTGAGRGLGQVMTLGLLEAGARVAAVEIDAPALEETENGADQRGAGERIQGIVADITRDDSAPKIVRATMEHFGRLDILINNAGINTSLQRPEGQPVGKFWEVTPTEFRRVIDVNVVAVFLMTRAALPVLLKQGWGRIINVTTSLDTMYRAGIQPYGGSKAANEAHLLAMAQELEGSGVSANVLVPGGAAHTRLVSRAPERRWRGSNSAVRRSCRTAWLEASSRNAALHGIGEGFVGDTAVRRDGEQFAQVRLELFQLRRRHLRDHLPGRSGRHQARVVEVVEAREIDGDADDAGFDLAKSGALPQRLHHLAPRGVVAGTGIFLGHGPA